MTAAVVTGGGNGLGAGISRCLAKRGIDVVVNYRRSVAEAQDTVHACRAEGVRATAVVGDVARPETSDALAEAAMQLSGSLDVWVNNAGVSTIAPLLDTDDDTFRRMFEVNVLGVQYGMRAASRVMRAHGIGGRIVNLASDAALQAFPLLGAYAATKFAVRAMTQAAALELAPFGITVNAVCPGTAETAMNEREWALETALTGRDRETVRAAYLAAIPAGRFVQPDDVGETVAWLATEPTRFVTGQSICVNGATVLH